ncbi:MAG: S16 family serine protease, partial [Terriglobia bacterium]
GKVLPIGGVKEKLMAAHRAGCRTAVLPKDNEKDLADVPESIQKEIAIRFVENMDEVLDLALERVPEGRPSLGAEASSPPPTIEPGSHEAEREPLAN